MPADSPAPWTLKCEAYGIPFRLNPKELPPGLYHDLDTPPLGKGNDDFRGGYVKERESDKVNTDILLCMIQIVRYHSTPVGPYDELLIIPGYYGVPGGKYKGRKQLRATRFYVSQRETTYNGRKNWNIPKQLARFEFSAPPASETNKVPKELQVKVFPYGSDSKTPPFFSCTLSPLQILPGLPATTKLLPKKPYLVQPPVGQGKGKGEDPLLYETDRWCGIPITSSSRRMRLMKVKIDEPPEEERKNGTHWPVVKTWSFGLWLEDVTLEFPVAEEFRL
ncbi:uncharacterized protein PV09_02497 [Verruconis gallopava]|uniref:Uncharacterized protein n=1 Tax=Verruconis gallopava TaxID=253628 RepID=A0A0D1Z1K5_9PEZI|nr:uncharacterized protein PV09_02497 [Verruconis gallopava]KIW06817.1 hypothetical protein PV09_02497 [Verruconis gallopava]